MRTEDEIVVDRVDGDYRTTIKRIGLGYHIMHVDEREEKNNSLEIVVNYGPVVEPRLVMDGYRNASGEYDLNVFLKEKQDPGYTPARARVNSILAGLPLEHRGPLTVALHPEFFDDNLPLGSTGNPIQKRK